MATVQIGDEIHASRLDPGMEIRDLRDQKTAVIPLNLVFKDVPSNFELIFTIYRKSSFLIDEITVMRFKSGHLYYSFSIIQLSIFIL